MRITLAELREKEDLFIALLEILSIEGQQYVARLSINNRPYLLSDSDGQTSMFRSSWEARESLGEIPVQRTEIVHASAYNEMIGMDSNPVAPLRVQVGKQTS